jgi:hypothetical protein
MFRFVSDFILIDSSWFSSAGNYWMVLCHRAIQWRRLGSCRSLGNGHALTLKRMR